MIVDQYTDQRDGNPLHIGEDTLITLVFQTWKCEISGPIDTDIYVTFEANVPLALQIRRD